MPDPLSADVVASLKIRPHGRAGGGADPRRLVSRPRFVGDEGVWRPRTAPTRAKGQRRKAPGARARGNGVAKRHGAKKAAHANGRHSSREAAAKHDQALLALMQANPDATVTEIIRMNGRPRNSTVLIARAAREGRARRARQAGQMDRGGS